MPCAEPVGSTRDTHNLTGRHLLANRDGHVGQERVAEPESLAIVDGDREVVDDTPGEGNDAGQNRLHAGSGWSPEVDTPVSGKAAGRRVGHHDRPGHWQTRFA